MLRARTSESKTWWTHSLRMQMEKKKLWCYLKLGSYQRQTGFFFTKRSVRQTTMFILFPANNSLHLIEQPIAFSSNRATMLVSSYLGHFFEILPFRFIVGRLVEPYLFLSQRSGCHCNGCHLFDILFMKRKYGMNFCKEDERSA